MRTERPIDYDGNLICLLMSQVSVPPFSFVVDILLPNNKHIFVYIANLPLARQKRFSFHLSK